MWVRAFQELSTEFMEITDVHNFWLKANVCYYECLYKHNLYRSCMHAAFCLIREAFVVAYLGDR